MVSDELYGKYEYGAPAGIIKFLFSRLQNGLLLNVGAGETYLDDPGKRVVGLDIVIPKRVQDDYVLGDATSLPFKDSIFDACLVKDVVEHVLDPIVALREIHRVTTTRAKAIIITPRAIPRAVWADPTHIRGFTQNSIKMLMELSGWKIVSGPNKFGGIPGATRLKFERHIENILKLPGLGHYFGTNWIVEVEKLE